MRNKKLIALFAVLCSLTLLILFNSVFFSVQNIRAYCYNADHDSELETAVLQKSKIKRGSSIFLLNETDLIKNIESKVSGIKVINIEKKFPNTVYINFVKVEDYLKFYNNGKVYYISNSGKITHSADSSEDNTALPEFKFKGNFKEDENDDTFKTDNPNDAIMLEIVLSALERLMYRGEIIQLFETIDFTKGYIYFKTRSGVYWELQSVENAFQKLRLAYSVYVNYGAEANEIKSGTFILTGRDKATVAYTSVDRYTVGIK